MVRENRGIKERNEERWVREDLLLLPFPSPLPSPPPLPGEKEKGLPPAERETYLDVIKEGSGNVGVHVDTLLLLHQLWKRTGEEVRE